MNRTCGDCTLCCTLLPVKALGKPASTRCDHQRGRGCNIYRKEGFPFECGLWNCRWLVDDTTTKLLRPDISHYVIDIVPDFVTGIEAGRETQVPVLQIWCDPRYPDAHRDPNFREWMRQHEPHCCALVRYNEGDAVFLIPPHRSSTGEWEEIGNNRLTIENRTHSGEEIGAVLTNSGAMK